MGQKTHPTGFRTGVNKTHNATWFANYGAYSEVLKEDYKIRKFFEKKFDGLRYLDCSWYEDYINGVSEPDLPHLLHDCSIDHN